MIPICKIHHLAFAEQGTLTAKAQYGITELRGEDNIERCTALRKADWAFEVTNNPNPSLHEKVRIGFCYSTSVGDVIQVYRANVNTTLPPQEMYYFVAGVGFAPIGNALAFTDLLLEWYRSDDLHFWDRKVQQCAREMPDQK